LNMCRFRDTIYRQPSFADGALLTCSRRRYATVAIYVVAFGDSNPR